MIILPNKVVRWQEGRVDRSREHMELRYGSADHGGWDDWVPVVLVAPPIDGVVTVEWLLKPDDPANAEVVSHARRDIQFYLIDECQIDRPPDFHPWYYAIYHCTTMSNLYSRVHWAHVAPEVEHTPPQPVELPGGQKGYFRPEQGLPEDGVDPVIGVRELEFLWWLGRYVGTWDVEGTAWEVGRAPDGYLEVWPQRGRRTPSLTSVIGHRKKVAEAPGPLGPRPVYFSEELARVWLTPEERPALLAAAGTSEGAERLMGRIEQRILEHNETDQKRGWFWLWSHFARVRPVEHKDRCLGSLRRLFEIEHHLLSEERPSRARRVGGRRSVRGEWTDAEGATLNLPTTGRQLHICVVEPPCTEEMVHRLLDIGPDGRPQGAAGGLLADLSLQEQLIVMRGPSIAVGVLDYLEAALSDSLHYAPEPMEAVESLFDSRPLPVIDETLIASVVEAMAIKNSSPYQPAPAGQVVAFLREHLGKKAFATAW